MSKKLETPHIHTPPSLHALGAYLSHLSANTLDNRPALRDTAPMDFRFAPRQSAAEDAAAGLETAQLPQATVPAAPVLAIGPPPADGRSPLVDAPGISEPPELSFRGPLMEQRLLSTALELMDHGPPKVRAAVWRDLMEVNGFLRRGPSETPPAPIGSPTLNALILGDRVANPLVEALGQLARALPVAPQ